MINIFNLRLVVDTNVVFEGLTSSGSASDLIVTAWLAGFWKSWCWGKTVNARR